MKVTLLRSWKRLLPLSLSLLLIWWVVRHVSLREVAATLANLSLVELALLVTINALVIVLLALRWDIFLRIQGCRVPLLQLVSYRLTAFGVSYFTPGPHIGGEPVQVYLPVARQGIGIEKSIIAVALDKTLELLVNFAFLVVAALYVLDRDILTGGRGLTVVIYALVLLAVPVSLLVALCAGRHPLSTPLRWWQTRHPSDRLVRVEARVRYSEGEAGLLCRQHPAGVALALGTALLAWAVMIGEFWLATHVLDIDLTLSQALVAMLAVRLAILLPMPAGLGALEASLVMAMELLGVGGAAGLSLALLIRTRDVLLGLLGLALGGAGLWRRPASTPSHAATTVGHD